MTGKADSFKVRSGRDHEPEAVDPGLQVAAETDFSYRGDSIIREMDEPAPAPATRPGPNDVPGKPAHRGPDPRDALAFASASLPALRGAAADFCWLLSRGYATNSALKLVGDRFNLTERQRQAVRRSACSDQARARRLARRCEATGLAGCDLLLDGFNILTTIEAALGGAVVLSCRDETFRDIAGLHGTYRRVAETAPALDVLGEAVSGLCISHCRWLFDRPVSNSGRNRGLFLDYALEHGQEWSVELVDDPDPILKKSAEIVATADSAVLDECARWFNLARHVVENHDVRMRGSSNFLDQNDANRRLPR